MLTFLKIKTPKNRGLKANIKLESQSTTGKITVTLREASPDDVQMINVCKITTISQTVCIIPSVPAHLLQLLRDGTGGSLLKTTRPNFKHFLPTLRTCLLLSIPVSPPWSEEMARSRAGDRSSQTPPPSTRSGVRAAFSASLEEPIRRSSMTMTSLLRETETFFFLVFFVS